MNVQQLVEQFRVDSLDREQPYLWGEPEVLGWLNEAQAEAAVRGRLLLDDSTPAVCEVDVAAGAASHQLHPKVYEISHLRFVSTATSRARGLDLVSREFLDSKHPHWRDHGQGEPRFAIQTETRLRLVPVPREAGTLRLETYRLPLELLTQGSDEPEIHEAHHAYLVHWALHRAFSQPDADGFDAQRSAEALSKFEAYFGARPDSDLRRATRHDEPQVTVVHTL